MTHAFPQHTHAQRLDVAGEADFCVKWLRVQNLEVLAVKQGRVCPVITIRSSELCKGFEDQVQAYERGPKGTRRYRFVIRSGCEVRWADHAETYQRPALSRLKSLLLGRLGAV